MGTEVWFRNPHDYIRELVEVGESKIAWDRGLLVKRHIDPVAHALLYFGTSTDYRVLCVGTQGTAEYRSGDTLDKPTAVYPTWAYGEDSILLEDMIENPMGEDELSCNDSSVRDDERPVLGQEHRVVITEMPDTRTGPGRAFLRYLKELQQDNPTCIIHVHGLYGWRHAFGMEFGAADIAPREAASKGRIHLPGGSIEKWEKIREKPQWARNLGFHPEDLSVPRNRCMYNIKSALWAGANYVELLKFRSVPQADKSEVDYESSDKDHVPDQTKSVFGRSLDKTKIKEGDRFLCDTCSLQNTCKYFRIGSVCTVPGAEPVKLASMFNTRNADDIIDGLSMIAAASANRLERSMEIEQQLGDVDPEVTKMMGQVFTQGEKLVKLVDPARFSTAKVQVNVGQNGSAEVQGGMANPRELVRSVVQSLVQQGYRREDITQDMIQGVLEGMANPDGKTKAIQGSVVDRGESA